MTDPSKIAVPVTAATLMLLRDGPAGVEVLMMVRHEKSSFGGGAMVFPGGKVEAVDAEIAAGATDAFPLGLKVAAIRETWEECGILLARDAASTNVLSKAELEPVRATRAEDFAQLLALHGLVPATDLLVPFANWITPSFSPKRFDTHFFIAKASTDQVALHDGHEAVEVSWLTPAAAIEAADAGRRSLLPPTYLNLRKISNHPTADAVIAVAAATPVVVVTPERETTGSGTELVIPEAAGYGVTRFVMGNMRNAGGRT